MAKFESKSIPLDDLYLDEENPRFIVPPNPKQTDIIRHLIMNEGVDKLAMKIDRSKGFYAGERVIACKEHGRYVVLEGNRRVCACKILKNLQLLGNVKPASVKSFDVSKETLDNISVLDVDILPSRTMAQSALASKHIDGIKKWTAIAKQKFFAIQFEAGKPLEEIMDVTGSAKNTIKRGIKEYKLIKYALELPMWTEEESENYLNLEDLKISRFIRVFSANSKEKELPPLKEILQLSEDEYFNPITTIKKEHFDYCIYLIARAAFVDKNDFNTRNTYLDVPGLKDYLIKTDLLPTNNKKSNELKSDKQENEDIDRGDPGTNQNSNPSSTTRRQDTSSAEETNTQNYNTQNNSSDKGKIEKSATSKRSTVIPSAFGCTCSSSKINNITVELKELNVHKFTNSCAVLLRVYLELNAKYYLTKTGKAEKIEENKLRDTLKNAINLMGSRHELTDKSQRSMLELIDKNHAITIFNGYVHYDDVHPFADSVINYFDNFETFIRLCLEK
ncbi:MAG: hypothetical protein K0R19_2837 [Bacillota bacterium]|nr:hypothetical protein [Bacillota bacterium]